MYYLYKITSKVSKHYYIGVTGNLKKRQQAHFITIYNILYYKINGKEYNLNCMPIHRLIADQVLGNKNQPPSFKWMVEFGYSFKVIATSKSRNGISKKENDELKKCMTDSNCLNVQKSSHYSRKK